MSKLAAEFGHIIRQVEDAIGNIDRLQRLLHNEPGFDRARWGLSEATESLGSARGSMMDAESAAASASWCSEDEDQPPR